MQQKSHNALSQKNVVCSWKVTSDRNDNTMFILRFTAQSSDITVYHPLQKEVPRVKCCETRGEQRKDEQQRSTNNPKQIMVNNKDINRQVNFKKIMLKFCLLVTKIMNEARTQRVHNTACLKTDKLKWGCQRLCWHVKQMRVCFCSQWNCAWLEWHMDRTDKSQWKVWLFAWGKCVWALVSWKQNCQF